MTYNPFELTGKTILVTGASSGIGKATAIECSKLGASLVITARNETALNETFLCLEGIGHTKIISDLTNNEDLSRVVSEVPSLDGVALCAGISQTLPFQFCSKEKFDEVFSINFNAPIELLRMMVKKKKLNKGSSVVFVSSVDGINKFHIGNSVYSAGKAALSSMMKSCALELASKKIRVNAVNPGMVDTKLIRSGSFTDEQLEQELLKYPLDRIGQPKDIAEGIIYLLSDASSWITGINLTIDGGFSLT